MQKIFIKTLSLVIVFSTLAFTSPVFATESSGDQEESNTIYANPFINVIPFDSETVVNSLTVTATSTAKFIVEAPETYTQNEDGTYTATFTFTENGTHVFTVMDTLGNTAKETVTVENIDNIGPGIDTLPYNTDPTSESIVVTAITDEGAYFTSPNPLTITQNGTYEFIAKDAAGNESSYSITITNIIPRVVNTNSSSRGGGSSGGTIDRCSNIPGVQATVPAGYVVDGNRNCTLPTVVTNPVGQVLGAETEGQVLGAEKFKFTLDLKFGDKNDEVMELQKRLIADGLMTGPATGLFWTKTLAGVREFQRLNGIRTTNGVIKTTGNVGILTRAALNK